MLFSVFPPISLIFSILVPLFSIAFFPFLILIAPFILLHIERVPFNRMGRELGFRKFSLDSIFSGGILFLKVMLVLIAQSIILRAFNLLDTDLVREVARAQGIDFFIIAIILAPIGEELLFRGYFLSRLLKRVKFPWIAIIFTSAVFAALHFGYGSVAEVSSAFLYSLIVSADFVKRKDILSCITAHFLLNSLFLATL